MSRKIAGIIALATLLFAAAIQGPIVGVSAELPSRGEPQSEVHFVDPAVERLWSDIPIGITGASQEKREAPIGYSLDVEELRELESQPAERAQDVDPVIEADSTFFEPKSPDPIYLLQDFEGPDQQSNADVGTGAMRPPDPHIAVGLDHVGVMVNSMVAFYTKTGTLVANASLSDWWSNVHTGGTVFDPRIAYDHHDDHWLMVALVATLASHESWVLLSVSQTDDPTGAWWNYRIDGALVHIGADTWADYPDLGFDGISPVAGGAIYITTNQFTWEDSAWGEMFRTATLYILPKWALYIGSGLSAYRTSNLNNADGTPAFTLRTAHTFGNPGMEYLVNTRVGINTRKLTLWRVIPTYPPDPLDVTRQATLNIGPYSFPPSARQLGGPATLDTIDNRIYGCMYRNGYLYAAFTEAHIVSKVESYASIRYLKINTNTNNADLNEAYGGADGNDYYFPAIYTDNADNMVMVFARSSPTEFAGIYYAERMTTDTSMGPPTLLKAGETHITGFRWGDYFGIANDPANPSRVWIYGEWAKDVLGYSSDWDWGTWIGCVSFTPNQSPVADSDGPYTGTEGVPVVFDGSGSYDPDGTPLSYEWWFGDGETGTGVNPAHTYDQDGSYVVILTVTDDLGDTAFSATSAVISNTGPTADFSAEPRSGNPPLTVSFTDLSTSYDGIVSWFWEFGDGENSTLQNPIHTYTGLGTYSVSLTVQEADGDDHTFSSEGYLTTHLFVLETLDIFRENSGWYTSIALDSNDRPHISYYDSASKDLKYTMWSGTAWNNETVDSAGDVGWYTSIALDSGDDPHMSYYNWTGGSLKYARYEKGVGWIVGKTVDSAGLVGWYTSLALDSDDKPHISYYDQTNGDLKYAAWNGAAWNIETVDSAGDVGSYTSIALDSSDYPHISYHNATDGTLKYARWNGVAWNIETVDSAKDANVGSHSSIALDSGDDPHISYYDQTNGDLKYARYEKGVGWTVQAIDSAKDEGEDVGWYTSIALDSKDYPHISYYDVTSGDLKYVRQTSATWVLERIDSEDDVGRYTSIALDSDDGPHISYRDQTNGKLKYARLIRDVAVTSVSPHKSIVGEGYLVSINVTVANQGAYTETFDVTFYANGTNVSQMQVILTSGSSTTITLTWDTTGFIYGNYTMSAIADFVPRETDTADNTLEDGEVLVTIPGDVNGDGIVDIFDIGYISAHWYPGPPVGPSGYDANADINNDGAVDIFDIGIASAHWGESW